MYSVVKKMNLAYWPALLQTTKKQEIHGAFTGQLNMAFIIINDSVLKSYNS
jgi:hypothetical protein